jgi:membrane associated rhomboid family serine protease
MGIYDREYYREDEAGRFGARSMVLNLVLINVGIYVAELFLGNNFFGASLESWLSLKPDLFSHPWHFYQLVTYGFVHDPDDLRHIVFNMLFLWFAGRDVEGIYGPKEFLRIYLTAIILAGLVYVIAAPLTHSFVPVLGASGGIMAILALYALHFPRRTILFMFVIPLPAWVVFLIFFISDVSGAIRPTDNTAHVAHVAGAVFGFIYYRSGWNLGRWIPSGWKWSGLRPRPKLRVHEPDVDEHDLKRQMDEILRKITRTGEESLTRQERRILEEASRRFRRRQT